MIERLKYLQRGSKFVSGSNSRLGVLVAVRRRLIRDRTLGSSRTFNLNGWPNEHTTPLKEDVKTLHFHPPLVLGRYHLFLHFRRVRVRPSLDSDDRWAESSEILSYLSSERDIRKAYLSKRGLSVGEGGGASVPGADPAVSAVDLE